jgi:hypothetical protein
MSARHVLSDTTGVYGDETTAPEHSDSFAPYREVRIAGFERIAVGAIADRARTREFNAPRQVGVAIARI